MLSVYKNSKPHIFCKYFISTYKYNHVSYGVQFYNILTTYSIRNLTSMDVIYKASD